MEMSEALELFLRRKRPATQRAYRGAMFGLEVHSGKPLEKVVSLDILKYLDRIGAKVMKDGTLYSPVSARHQFHCLSSVFKFLHEVELIQKNPTSAAKHAISWRQEEQKRPTAALQFGLVRKALRAETSKNLKKSLRNRGILALLFGAGLRRSEALGLKVGDVRVNPFGVLYLNLQTTKAGKSQVRVLAKFAHKYVSQLVLQRKREEATDADPLLVCYREDGSIRGPLSVASLYRTFRNAMKQLGIDAAPHAARAAFATQLKRLGVDDREVAAALGHGSANMVHVYDKRRMTLEESPALMLKV